VRQADQVEARTDKNLPPPVAPQSSFDTAALQREADELAGLASSVPPAVQNVRKGMLPKDLLERLKRIEKLSKHLRSELSR
jgi:hypothetical protein